MTDRLSRRGVIAAGITLVPGLAMAQAAPKAMLGAPRSVISDPPREFGPRAQPSYTPDPDVLRADPAFDSLLIGQEAIRRVATGFHFLEGPAWSSEGQYAIFSDVKNDTLYRYLWESGEVTRLPQAVLQHQRQQFRLSGTAVELPGLFPPRDPLGSGRFDDRAGGQFRRQAAELTERSGAAPRWQRLVHRSHLWRRSGGRPSR